MNDPPISNIGTVNLQNIFSESQADIVVQKPDVCHVENPVCVRPLVRQIMICCQAQHGQHKKYHVSFIFELVVFVPKLELVPFGVFLHVYMTQPQPDKQAACLGANGFDFVQLFADGIQRFRIFIFCFRP